MVAGKDVDTEQLHQLHTLFGEVAYYAPTSPKSPSCAASSIFSAYIARPVEVL